MMLSVPGGAPVIVVLSVVPPSEQWSLPASKPAYQRAVTFDAYAPVRVIREN